MKGRSSVCVAGDGITTTGVCFVGGSENSTDLEVSGWGWVVMQLISYCHLQYETCQSQPSVFLQLLVILRFATRVGTLIVATIYLQLIQNRYMFRSFTVLQCSHQHCVQPVASDVEVIGYL